MGSNDLINAFVLTTKRMRYSLVNSNNNKGGLPVPLCVWVYGAIPYISFPGKNNVTGLIMPTSPIVFQLVSKNI